MAISDPEIYHYAENYEIEKNTQSILSILEDLGIKATFFFLGRIAVEIPGVVRETAACGHEIGCHGLRHLRVFGMSRDEFKEGLSVARKTLEDVSGNRVYGFRAPDFSITRSSIWALDVLRELDFVYDSSIYPTGMHDVYGIKDAKTFINETPSGIIEFPLSTANLSGIRFPFGGGGYFRLYPLPLTEYLIRRHNRLGHPCMLYLHPYEVGTEIPHIAEISSYRKFRHYYNCKNGEKRLRKILQQFEFATAIEMLKENNYYRNGYRDV